MQVGNSWNSTVVQRYCQLNWELGLDTRAARYQTRPYVGLTNIGQKRESQSDFYTEYRTKLSFDIRY